MLQLKINGEEIPATPFYYYDTALLRRTIAAALDARGDDRHEIHYAVKANSNPRLLRIIAGCGLGADCVSAGEIRLALEAGFPARMIVFAGVAKGDDEIETAIREDIGCMNVESLEELEVIASIARRMGARARVALRVNPDIDAHTHHFITTGLEEDKFGIDRRLMDEAVDFALAHPELELTGLHFHIGSQILTMEPFKILCQRINTFVDGLRARGVTLATINVGGGLGIDYDDPDANPVADFKGFFDTLNANLRLADGQKCLCELGRSIVAQCGSLVTRVRYVKKGVGRKFVILDAGMNDLIRPALYQAVHKVENLSAGGRDEGADTYDVVGPICESSDTFAKSLELPVTRRGDIMAIRSAGAYGETMSSQYNSRPLPKAVLN